MAGLLGISLSRLQSYEYGRTMGVNPKVMASVMKLASDPRALARRSARTSIRTQAKAWMSRLGAPANTVTGLARVLDVDRVTVSRWLSTGRAHQEPEPRRILHYEQLVGAAERAIALYRELHTKGQAHDG